MLSDSGLETETDEPFFVHNKICLFKITHIGSLGKNKVRLIYNF